MAKENGFDGVDLAWQFPVISNKYKSNILGKLLLPINVIVMVIDLQMVNK